MTEESRGGPRVWTVIRENWLSRRPHPGGFWVAAWMTLFVAFGSLLYWHDVQGAAAWMAASKASVLERGEWWRLWTSLIVHSDARHLLSNSFLFFILGGFLNAYFGKGLFPGAAFLFGGLINLLVLISYPPNVNLVGASGVVFWMGGAWLALYLLLETSKSLFQRSLRSGGVALMLFMPAEAFDPSVSYRAHFIGFALGVGAGLFYYVLRRRTFKSAEVREVQWEESDPGEAAVPGPL